MQSLMNNKSRGLLPAATHEPRRIALLVSILLPSLQKAKQMGQNVTCQSNLHHLGVASLMYATENNSVLYPIQARWWGYTGDNMFWEAVLVKTQLYKDYNVVSTGNGGYGSFKDPDSNVSSDSFKWKFLFYCPRKTYTKNLPNLGQDNTSESSYGANDSALAGDSWLATTANWISIERWAPDTLLLGECAFEGGSRLQEANPKPSASNAKWTLTSTVATGPPYSDKFFNFYRHFNGDKPLWPAAGPKKEGKGNFLFITGAVESRDRLSLKKANMTTAKD